MTKENKWDNEILSEFLTEIVEVCEIKNISPRICFETIIRGSLLLTICNKRDILSLEAALKFVQDELTDCYKSLIQNDQLSNSFSEIFKQKKEKLQ